MRMYRRLLLIEFFPFFLLGIIFFALILVLADMFANLWQYLNREIPITEALKVSFLYAPKALSWSLPIGAMFAAAFSLGNLGARNELISIYGSGVPLFRFLLPMLFVALLISIGGYFWEDYLAVPLLREKSALSKTLLGIRETKNRSQAVIISVDGQVAYYTNFYNDKEQTITGVTVIIMDENKKFAKRIDAERGEWDAEAQEWHLQSCRIFTETENGDIVQTYTAEYRDELLVEEPDTFRLDTREVEEMNDREARDWINTQRRAGLPYKAQQAELYQRYTVALTPFLVVLFAGSLAGRFRRNILLMSLLVSLLLASGWYVARMISTLLSKQGMISPLMGAVVPYLLFLAFGLWLFRYAKT